MHFPDFIKKPIKKEIDRIRKLEDDLLDNQDRSSILIQRSPSTVFPQKQQESNFGLPENMPWKNLAGFSDDVLRIFLTGMNKTGNGLQFNAFSHAGLAPTIRKSMTMFGSGYQGKKYPWSFDSLSKKIIAKTSSFFDILNTTYRFNAPPIYVGIDIETTGLIKGSNMPYITEIGLTKFNRAGNILEKYSSLVNPPPGIRWSPEAQRLTKITPQLTAGAPYFRTIAPDIKKFIGNYPLVGQNIKHFDIPVLSKEFTRSGLHGITGGHLDTLELAKKTLPNLKSYSQINLAKTLGIPFAKKSLHRAPYDIELGTKIFANLLEKINVQATHNIKFGSSALLGSVALFSIYKTNKEQRDNKYKRSTKDYLFAEESRKNNFLLSATSFLSTTSSLLKAGTSLLSVNKNYEETLQGVFGDKVASLLEETPKYTWYAHNVLDLFFNPSINTALEFSAKIAGWEIGARLSKRPARYLSDLLEHKGSYKLFKHSASVIGARVLSDLIANKKNNNELFPEREHNYLSLGAGAATVGASYLMYKTLFGAEDSFEKSELKILHRDLGGYKASSKYYNKKYLASHIKELKYFKGKVYNPFKTDYEKELGHKPKFNTFIKNEEIYDLISFIGKRNEINYFALNENFSKHYLTRPSIKIANLFDLPGYKKIFDPDRIPAETEYGPVEWVIERLKQRKTIGNWIIKPERGCLSKDVFLDLNKITKEDIGTIEKQFDNMMIQKKLNLQGEYRVVALNNKPLYMAHRWGGKYGKGLLNVLETVSPSAAKYARESHLVENIIPVFDKGVREKLTKFTTDVAPHYPTELLAFDIGHTKTGQMKMIESQFVFGTLDNPIVANRLIKAVTGQHNITPLNVGLIAGIAAIGAGLIAHGLSKKKRNESPNRIDGFTEQGLASSNRKRNTPFGSKIDPIRRLAATLGYQYGDFLVCKTFQEALQYGRQLKELGRGVSGTAHLMEGEIEHKGIKHVFNYVQKTIDEAKSAKSLLSNKSLKLSSEQAILHSNVEHEYKMMEQFRNTNTIPSVYRAERDSGFGSIYMEYMDKYKELEVFSSSNVPVKERSKILKSAAFELYEDAKTVKKAGIYNPDIHSRNILYNSETSKAAWVDWGLASDDPTEISKHVPMNKLMSKLLSHRVTAPPKFSTGNYGKPKKETENSISGFSEKGMGAFKRKGSKFGSGWIDSIKSGFKRLWRRTPNNIDKYWAKIGTKKLLDPVKAVRMSENKTLEEFASMLTDTKIKIIKTPEQHLWFNELESKLSAQQGGGLTALFSGAAFIKPVNNPGMLIMNPERIEKVFSLIGSHYNIPAELTHSAIKSPEFMKTLLYHEYLEGQVFNHFSKIKMMPSGHASSQVLFGEGGFIANIKDEKVKEFFKAFRKLDPTDTEYSAFTAGFDGFQENCSASISRKKKTDFGSGYRGLLMSTSKKIAKSISGGSIAKTALYKSSKDLKVAQKYLSNIAVNGGHSHKIMARKTVPNLYRT